MTRKLHLSVAAGIALAALSALASKTAAKPISYELPAETAALKPGPGLDAVQSNCGACHSVDYITTQPRGPKFGREFWTAEVTKMIKVYGAPIQESDIQPIVDYLATNH